MHGLFTGGGIFVTYIGPLFCVIWAVFSGANAFSRRAHLLSSLNEPAAGERIDPRWGDGLPVDAPPIDTGSWSTRLLQALEWKRLEQLCAAYFRTLKFRVEEATHGPDGGVDLRLYEGSAKTPGVLVQCKAWNSWKVGVKEIRELFGVMAAEGVNEGILVTTSTFTDEATAFAQGKNIALIDGADLLTKLRSLPTEDQELILGLVTAGDFTTPTCPSCGIKMVSRVAQATGDLFWGCVRYPACRSTISTGRNRPNA